MLAPSLPACYYLSFSLSTLPCGTFVPPPLSYYTAEAGLSWAQLAFHPLPASGSLLTLQHLVRRHNPQAVVLEFPTTPLSAGLNVTVQGSLVAAVRRAVVKTGTTSLIVIRHEPSAGRKEKLQGSPVTSEVVVLPLGSTAYVYRGSNGRIVIGNPVQVTREMTEAVRPWAFPCVGRVAVTFLNEYSNLLAPVLGTVLVNLGPDWKLQIFCATSESLDAILEHRLLRRMVVTGVLVLTSWENPVRSIDHYSATFTSERFWSLVAAERVLIFQLDSVLCANALWSVDDPAFAPYDFIGAPWAHRGITSEGYLPQFGGNGGLSLRSRSASLKVVRQFPWRHEAEDLYFTRNLPRVGAKVAPDSVAERLAVESGFFLGSVGVHQPWLSGPKLSSRRGEFRRELEDYCPEYRMVGRYE